MGGVIFYLLIAVLGILAIGGAAFAFAGDGSASKKRLAAATGAPVTAAARAVTDANQQRRRNVSVLLKELEKQQAEKKQRLTIRRRIEQAGLSIEPRTFWIGSAIAGLVAIGGCELMHQSIFAALFAGVALGLGLPRWVLNFLKARREKAFTAEFANAIDVIVRSVKSGLPTNEALKIVAKEISDPVGSEFSKLVEGMKVGVTLEQGMKKMFDSMPTAEVSFFGIVMTIQQKSGGNLSEALSNLAGVLRDRKRLQGKIRAMSSEAKASAMIIGSLPPGVMALVYITTPAYIALLFSERMGNIMLAACVVWMTIGILVMKKMISFKH
ncbi:MAG TPA: type II secretion system F family protein [Rhizomicrobium sp.]|jgi:tight adherence protein B|nr:type II secretion system F family protein [Rhizomicrobium sp.]